jgi:ribonuclease HIII
MTKKQTEAITQLKAHIDEFELDLVAEKEIPYARQLKIGDGLDEITINVYTSGKIVVGGKKTPLREQLEEWKNLFLAEAKGESPLAPGYKTHIGADEAGKGDYFGPLVVAAAHVTQDAAYDLIRWGVRDSKAMSDSVISELALKIRERCSNVVEILMPPEYNQAYRRHRNLNQLLAEMHARAIAKLVRRSGCKRVIVDQFGDPRLLERFLEETGVRIELEQRVRGEVDVAVAAASILAREGFLPEIVVTGREILKRWGPKGLERIAKLHFKTTSRVLGRPLL